MGEKAMLLYWEKMPDLYSDQDSMLTGYLLVRIKLNPYLSLESVKSLCDLLRKLLRVKYYG
jgi:hypothetical protein